MIKIKKPFLLIFTIIFCQAAGLIGAFFNSFTINTWYDTLQKPSFNPPGWIFAPVWTTLFLLMGISLYFVLLRYKKGNGFSIAWQVFLTQWILNVFWSFFFFTMQRPGAALVEIVFLWVMIMANIYVFYKIDKKAGLLLVPYWLWVSFAAVLNFTIWRLN